MRAKERIVKYGVKAFLKSLGKEAIKKRGGYRRLLKFYTGKYVQAPLEVEPPTKGRISGQMRAYWKDVKRIVEGRKLGIVKARKLMKKEGVGKDVKLRVIKTGEGWQLTLKAAFRDEKTGAEEDAEGFSRLHKERNYDECFDECVRFCQAFLGGSNWNLIGVYSYKWNRYFGREASISENGS